MWNKLLISAAALCLLLSCEGRGGEEVTISFAQNPLIVGSETAVYDCGLSCNAPWTASTKEGWVTILTAEGNKGDALQIRVNANTTDTERNATVSVKAGNAGKVLQLVQEADANIGFVSETKLSIDTYGTGTYISVNTDAGWTFSEPDVSWLKVEKKGPAAIGISATVNFTGSARKGGFTVSSTDGKRSAEVTVTQEFSNEKFLASTEFGRRLVYAMGSYVKSVSADSYRELTDGVAGFEMSCKLKDGLGGDKEPLNRNLFLFVVDMTKATVLVTLKDDDNANIKSRQLMSQQIPALQNKRSNLTVWGGTNGDFFSEDVEGSEIWTLQGVLYRGGTCLKSTFAQTTNTVFAVFKDGSARCMTQAQYNTVKGDITEAIGGRQHLLKEGSTVEFSDGTQHPRTAVGTSADGKTVYLLVVDGRTELHGTGSYSVSYEPLARILKAAGAADAINLDGGGSSTFIVRESNGSFSMHNKPGNSGRTERMVLNGLAVVTYK